jgi:hypothetical protein
LRLVDGALGVAVADGELAIAGLRAGEGGLGAGHARLGDLHRSLGRGHIERVRRRLQFGKLRLADLLLHLRLRQRQRQVGGVQFGQHLPLLHGVADGRQHIGHRPD